VLDLARQDGVSALKLCFDADDLDHITLMKGRFIDLQELYRGDMHLIRLVAYLEHEVESNFAAYGASVILQFYDDTLEFCFLRDVILRVSLAEIQLLCERRPDEYTHSKKHDTEWRRFHDNLSRSGFPSAHLV